MFKKTFWSIIALIVASCFLNGCSNSDEDVTLKPEYNFTSFAGTIWKSKVKLAVVDTQRYTGGQQLYLLAQSRLDPSASNYCVVEKDKIKAILPEGTLVRIERYMKDRGIGNSDQVCGTLMNGAYAQKNVVVDKQLFEKNQWLWIGWPNLSTNWGLNSDMFEEAMASK